jgi:hypothetical protein
MDSTPTLLDRRQQLQASEADRVAARLRVMQYAVTNETDVVDAEAMEEQFLRDIVQERQRAVQAAIAMQEATKKRASVQKLAGLLPTKKDPVVPVAVRQDAVVRRRITLLPEET